MTLTALRCWRAMVSRFRVLSLIAATLVSYSVIWACDSGAPKLGEPGDDGGASFDVELAPVIRGAQGTTATMTVEWKPPRRAGQSIGLFVGAKEVYRARATPLILTEQSPRATISVDIPIDAPLNSADAMSVVLKSGSIERLYFVPIEVLPGPAVALTVDSAHYLQRGRTVFMGVGLTRRNGFDETVSLSVSGLPPGVTSTVDQPGTRNQGGITLVASAEAAAGSYPVAITATATGSAPASKQTTLIIVPPYQGRLSVAPAALSVERGKEGEAVLVLDSVPPSSALTFNVRNLPAGVVGVIARDDAASSRAETRRLILRVAANATIGRYTLAVTGGESADRSSESVLELTIRELSAIGIRTGVGTTTLQPGDSVDIPVTVSRLGAFTGSVSLTTAISAGLTGTISTASLSPNDSTAVLRIRALPSASPGQYAATIRATGTNVDVREATVTVTVAEPTGPVEWRFCNPATRPLWFATYNVVAGAWERVAASGGDTYRFTPHPGRMGVAWVYATGSGGTQAVVRYLSSGEIRREAAEQCVLDPAVKTVRGSVRNAGDLPTQYASVRVSGSFPEQYDSGSRTQFTLANVADRTGDLLAVRGSIEQIDGRSTAVPDRVLLRRDINPAAGSTLGAIDFAVRESLEPAISNVTVTGGGADSITANGGFRTTNGPVGFLSNPPRILGAGTVRHYVVPTALLQTGDLYVTTATAVSADFSRSRSVVRYDGALGSRTIALGGAIEAPSVTALAGPYRRFRARGAWSVEYPTFASAGFFNFGANARAWSITISRAYAGDAANEYTLEIPDFTGVAGFDAAWALPATGAFNTSVTLTALNGGTRGNPRAGMVERSASIQGTTPP